MSSAHLNLHARRPSVPLNDITGNEPVANLWANPEDHRVQPQSSTQATGMNINRRSSGDSKFELQLDEEHEMMEAQRLIGKDLEEKAEIGKGASGPTGAAQVQQPSTVIPAYIIIPIWVGLSGGVILLNKHIFSNLNFPYPVFMTAYHMFFAMIGTRLLRWSPIDKLRPRPLEMDWHLWSRTILPLSLLFSASLVLSNMAYVYLSVSFVQMLKSFIPIFTLVVQLVAGLQEYNHLLFGVVVVTASGCITAAAGEIKFAFIGFVCQVCAVIVESTRLVLVQIILKDYKMDPLSSIAMYAPVCLVLIAICQPFIEGPAPFHNLHNVGAAVFLINGFIAFGLNIAGVFLIESAGSLVLTLSGVGKDVLLIFLAWLMGSYITFTQTVGYSIAIFGLMTFRLTGGSPHTPNGQRLVRFFSKFISPVQAILPGRIRLAGPRLTALLGAVIVMFAFGSVYIYAHPHYVPVYSSKYQHSTAHAQDMRDQWFERE